MYCNNCGHKNDDKTSFCVECGSRLEMIAAVDTPKKLYCGVCGSEIEVGSKYCEQCGASLEQKKHGGKKIAITIISVIMVIVLACSAVFGYNVLTNPMVKLQSAVKNTFGAKSLAFEISAGDDGDYIEEEGEIELDIDKEYFCLYLNNLDDKTEGWMRYEDSELTLYSKERGEKIEEEDAPKEVEEAIAKAFDALKGKADKAETLESLYADGLDEIKEYIHMDKVEKVGKQLLKKLASKQNMEKILGYRVSKSGSEKVYSFKPDLYELVLFLIDNSEELFTADAYDDILDAKDEILDEGPDSGDIPFVKLSLSTKGKYLVGFTFEYEEEDIELDVTLSNINKVKIDFPDR